MTDIVAAGGRVLLIEAMPPATIATPAGLGEVPVAAQMPDGRSALQRRDGRAGGKHRVADGAVERVAGHRGERSTTVGVRHDLAWTIR